MPKRYEAAVHTALNIPRTLDDVTQEQFRVLDYAEQADYAEKELIGASARMAELFEADIKRVQEGSSSQKPGGYSCLQDAARHAVELEERAKALRTMVWLLGGKDAQQAFNTALEAARAK